jgi:hypothetical protein
MSPSGGETAWSLFDRVQRTDRHMSPGSSLCQRDDHQSDPVRGDAYVQAGAYEGVLGSVGGVGGGQCPFGQPAGVRQLAKILPSWSPG